MQPRHRFSVFAGLQWTWTPSTHTNYSFFLKFDTRYINFIEKPYLPGKPSWKRYCNLQNLPEPLNQTPTPPHTHLLPLEDWMEHKRSWRKWMIAMKKTTLKLPFEESVLPDSKHLQNCWFVCISVVWCPVGFLGFVSAHMACHALSAEMHPGVLTCDATGVRHGNNSTDGSSSQTGTEYFLSCQDSFRWGGVCTTLV